MATSYPELKGAASAGDEDEKSAGIKVKDLRAALQLRFGDLIGRMEKRGLLCLDQSEGDTEDAENAACVVADEVDAGCEVGAMLWVCGGEETLREMLGPRSLSDMIAKAQDLADADDIVAMKAEAKIPSGVKRRDMGPWLLAGVIQAAAEASDRPMANSQEARKLLVEFVAAVRAWWAKTELDQKLSRYGQALQLTPRDIGALAVYSLKEADD